MNSLEEMWQELERYQPYADKRGFGAEWKQMTTERTEEAARAATYVAWSAGYAMNAAAGEAAARAAAADAAWWSQLAIENIRETILQEQEQT